MTRGNWTIHTLEKRIEEGERFLIEFAHDPDWLKLIQAELARKQGMLAELRDREPKSNELPSRTFSHISRRSPHTREQGSCAARYETHPHSRDIAMPQR